LFTRSCVSRAPGAAKPSAARAAFLKSREKAQQQWELERRLRESEASFRGGNVRWANHVRILFPLEGQCMPEPWQEQQKTQLVVRSPLSADGFVSIYFSSPDGRLMSEEEWWNLRQFIELANKVCVKQQTKAQSA
jgi:hypothetical protein